MSSLYIGLELYTPWILVLYKDIHVATTVSVCKQKHSNENSKLHSNNKHYHGDILLNIITTTLSEYPIIIYTSLISFFHSFTHFL